MPYFGPPIAAITLGQRAVVKSVRVINCSLLALSLLLLWSCASARVGFQSDGSYILERGEQSADCQALHKNIWSRMELIRRLPLKAKNEQAAVAPTASSLFGRWFGGPNKGLSAIQEYNRERAHVYALQRTMVEKKCVAIDVDAELAQTNAEMAQFR